MTRQLLFAIAALAVVVLLSACSTPSVSEESLKNATEMGAQPSDVIREDDDGFIHLDWTPSPDGIGWQVQYSVDGGYNWTNFQTKIFETGDRSRAHSVDVPYTGAASQVDVRVRTVYSHDEASQWVEVGVPIDPAKPVRVAQSCSQAMSEASVDYSEQALVGTLLGCATEAEWKAAAIQQPAAIDFTHASEADAAQFLETLCYGHPGTGFCP